MSNLGGVPGALIGSSITSGCPHCGAGMCVEGATGSYMEGTEPHRVDDGVTFFCGMGTTIIGLYTSTS